MACFDKSVYVKERASPAPTYHTYVCQSRDSYSAEYKHKLLQQPGNYTHLWNQHHKPPHISKLRHILSDTISNITKGDSLKKGESVELTLEIELMKTEINTPSNSLVEVTIIQHNKSDPNDNNHKILTNKMPLQIESNSTNSESASQKRQNWFKRVINKPNGVSSKAYLQTTTELYKKSYWNYTHESTGIKNKLNNKNPKNNFVTILPEEITVTDYAKGYRKVSPEKRTPIQKPKNVLYPKKDTVSLAKKLSDAFLPSKQSDQRRKTALPVVKNGLDKVKLKPDKEQGPSSKGKAPKQYFGKIVDNILGGMMEKSHTNDINGSKANTLPIPYQQFFEPVSKPKLKPLSKKKKTRKKLTNSHSDTCCVGFKEEFSNPKIKKSNSTSDCKAKKGSNKALSYNSGDLKRSYNRIEKKKRPKRYHRRTEKGDLLTQSSSNDKNLKRGHIKRRSIHSQKSVIEWNGQKIQVNKEIKTRIEMIIVNELQNLALKEGMECDVTPLPPTESSSNTIQSIEKVSSFVCELDISDRKIKKLTQNKNSTEKRLSGNSSSNVKLDEVIGTREKKLKTMVETFYEEKIESILQTGSQDNRDENQNIDIDSGKNKNESIINTISPIDDKSKNNEMEITYVNKFAKNWSDESTSFKFKNVSKKLPIETETFFSSDTVYTFGKEDKPCEKTITTGFVKKIDSNDSNWKNFSKLRTASSGQLINLAVSTTKSTIVFSSTTTHEYASSLEIELDIKDLESILKEAKQKQKADKVLINARCKRENKHQQKKAIKFSGKNSPSYTERLLKDASKKLEKCTKAIRK